LFHPRQTAAITLTPVWGTGVAAFLPPQHSSLLMLPSAFGTGHAGVLTVSFGAATLRKLMLRGHIPRDAITGQIIRPAIQGEIGQPGIKGHRPFIIIRGRIPHGEEE